MARSAVGRDRARLVDGLADDVHDAAERAEADRDLDRRAGVVHRLAAGEAFGRVHGDAADGVLAELLGDFENEPVALILGLERVQDLGQVALELDVDDGADDLRDAARRSRWLAAWQERRTCYPFSMSVRAPRRRR